jgi:hypothetical protein
MDESEQNEGKSNPCSKRPFSRKDQNLMNIKQNFKVSLAEFSKIFQCFSSIKQNVKKGEKFDKI